MHCGKGCVIPMYRIAVVGDRDSIYGFASVGLEIFPVDEGREALRTLKNLADNDYAIIYVTEVLYIELDAELAGLRERALPAIIAIPGASGNTGIGIAQVKRSVEKAVGSDIIFGND